MLKQPDQARQVEHAALAVLPKDARLLYQYGVMILKINRAEAIKDWQQAMVALPHYAACAIALGHEWVADRQYAQAAHLLEPLMATGDWPSSTWVDLGKARIGMHDIVGARSALRRAEIAYSVKPEEIEALNRQILTAVAHGNGRSGRR